MDSSGANSASAEETSALVNEKCAEPKNRPYNVYIKNISPDVDDENLETIFSEFGVIQSCTILRDHSGKSKQVGFVQFSSDIEANNCIENMHGKEGLGPKPLHVALTNPKPPRTPKRNLEFGQSLSFAGAAAQRAHVPLVPISASAPQPFYPLLRSWHSPTTASSYPVYLYPAPYQPYTPFFNPQQNLGFHYQAAAAGAPGFVPRQPAFHGAASPYFVPLPMSNMMMPLRPYCMAAPPFPVPYCGAPCPTTEASGSYKGYVQGSPPHMPFPHMP